MPSNFYTIIPHPIERKILLMPARDGWTLPVHNPTHNWSPQIESLVSGMREQLGIRMAVLYCVYLRIERARRAHLYRCNLCHREPLARLDAS